MSISQLPTKVCCHWSDQSPDTECQIRLLGSVLALLNIRGLNKSELFVQAGFPKKYAIQAVPMAHLGRHVFPRRKVDFCFDHVPIGTGLDWEKRFHPDWLIPSLS